MLSVHILTAIEGIAQHITKALRRPEFSSRLSVYDHSNVIIKCQKPDQDTVTELLKDADILVACPGLLDGSTLQKLPNLKWMQSTWDGVNKIMSTFDNTKPYPSFPLVRYVGNFGQLMTEYVLGYVIARERLIIPMYEFQKNREWRHDDMKRQRVLGELTIGVLGIGSIGKEICRQCSSHGMKTLGLVQSERRNPEKYLSKLFLPNQLTELLEDCDYVCNILPSTDNTRGLLDGDLLSACKNSPVFINVGRGDVISESSIINALDKGWISCAVLDVFAVEPLPNDSPLWLRNDVIITPHIAAKTDPEVMYLEFLANLRLFLDSKPFTNVVDYCKGY